jgi:hypothetical protein
MRLTTRAAVLVCSMLPCLLPTSGRAQWSAAIQISSDRFWGGSTDNTAEHRSFLPYRPTTFSAAVHRRGSKIGLGLRLGYSEASLGLEGAGGLVVAKGVFSIYSVAPDVSYRVARVGAGNSLWLVGGPLLEMWNIIDEGTRARLGAHGGLALVVPLGSRISAMLSGGLAVVPSPFDDGELHEEFELRTLWRRGLAGALEYRF